MVKKFQAIRAIKKNVEDCEIVIVDGVRYRDVTSLLFEESKYIKSYMSKNEWNRVNKQAEVEVRELRTKRLRDQEEREKERFAEIRAMEEAIRREKEWKGFRQKRNREAQRKAMEEFEKVQEQQVLAMLEDGMIQQDIRRQMGIGTYRLRMIINGLAEKGLVNKQVRKEYTTEEDAQIVKLRNEGETFASIGKIIGRTASQTANRYYCIQEKGLL